MMNKYYFESNAGKWALPFPDTESAIAHGKMHNVNKIVYNATIIAEKVLLQSGVKVFKVYHNSVLQANNYCADCD